MDHLRAKNTKNDFGIENRRMHEMEMGKKEECTTVKNKWENLIFRSLKSPDFAGRLPILI